MLGKVDLSQKVKKKKYKRRMPELQARLQTLQQAARAADVPVIVLFESWDAAGKGDCLRALTSCLDPRGFKLHKIREARAYEKRKPWMYRFWLKTPARGEMVIFDRSWYGRVLADYVDGMLSGAERRRSLQDIQDFERMLAEDGVLICKFFLHISAERQKKRFKKRLQNPDSTWRVEPEDWEQHAKYEDYFEAIDHMIENTSTEWSPWTVVAANNRRHAQIVIFETLIAALESRPEVKNRIPQPTPDDPVAESESQAPAVDTQSLDGAQVSTPAPKEPAPTREVVARPGSKPSRRRTGSHGPAAEVPLENEPAPKTSASE